METTIETNVAEIHYSLFDRIRILFGFKNMLRVEVKVEARELPYDLSIQITNQTIVEHE